MPKSLTRASERKPHPIDLHVGKRLRMRRSLLGISQEKLADAVNLTFQQIQKYERGTNRVSASRLYQFSRALDVPVAYFYQDYNEGKTRRPQFAVADNDQESFISDDTLYAKETFELLKMYYSLTDEKKRRELLKIIRSVIDSMDSGS